MDNRRTNNNTITMAPSCLSLVVYTLLSINLCGWISCAKMADYAAIESVLDGISYDSKIHPGAEAGQTTVVNLDLFINDISAISEVNMEYSIIVFFRQEWYDRRLIASNMKEPVTLSYKHLSKLWVPDTYMPNEKGAAFHDITVPNVLLRLDPDGKILYSQRISFRVICIMDLQRYPFDNQTCEANFESYGYTTNEIQLQWRYKDPVQVNTNLKLPEFKLTGIAQKNCTTVYVTGSFSCMSALLYFERQVTYFITQTFIPSILVVVLSWMSFWIDYKAVPARISLGLLTVLTITTQSSGISQRLPRVSYTKAIDVWMSVCLVFVFSALLEYSIVNVLARQLEKKQIIRSVVSKWRKSKSKRKSAKSAATMDTEVQREDVQVQEVKSQVWKKTCGGFFRIPDKYTNNKALFVDVVSRVLFPISFLIFNIVFWSLYH